MKQDALCRAIRDAGYVSLDAFARETGFCRTSLWYYMRRGRRPMRATLVRLAVALKLPPAVVVQLFEGKRGEARP
jgi:hypothetical protein